MFYEVYTTCLVGYNKYESNLYASYTDAEQASETVFYLRGHGLSASVEAFEEEIYLDDILSINLWIDNNDPYIVGKVLDKKGVINPNYPIIIEFNRDNENLDCYESKQTYQGTITNLLEQLHISTLSFYDFVLDKVIDFIEQMEVSQ